MVAPPSPTGGRAAHSHARTHLGPTYGHVEENAEILDPENEGRRTWRDPLTGILREIWMPGDGEGDINAEYYDQRKPPDDIKQRWKFYQSTNLDPTLHLVDQDRAFPPRFVVLDDRAAYEILRSNIPRTHLPQCWGLDFGGPGAVRQRRPHRGRGAVSDPTAEGNEQFHFGYLINKKDKYYFTGQKQYKPVIWYNVEKAQLKRKRELDLEEARRELEVAKRNRGEKGHNQHTPSELLVKTKVKAERERLKRYAVAAVVAGPEPELPLKHVLSPKPSTSCHTTAIDQGTAVPIRASSVPDTTALAASHPHSTTPVVGRNTPTRIPNDLSSSDEEFPFHRSRTARLRSRRVASDQSLDTSVCHAQQPTATDCSLDCNIITPTQPLIQPKGPDLQKLQVELEEKTNQLKVACARIAELEDQVAQLMRAVSCTPGRGL